MNQVYVYSSYQDPNYQLGYRFSDYSDDELVEKQGGGPTPADFIPFIASLSLPLTAALVTFVAIIVVYIWEYRVERIISQATGSFLIPVGKYLPIASKV